MANHKEFESWLLNKPTSIQELAREVPPWKLYSFKSINAGQIHKFVVYITSYNDGNGILTVEATREYNRCLLNRQIYAAPHQLKVVCENLHLDGHNHRIKWSIPQQRIFEEIEFEVHEKIIRWHHQYEAEGIPPGEEREDQIRKRLKAYMNMKHPETMKLIEIL